MTPAERALLVAVAKYMMEGTSRPYSNRCHDLNKAIAAVEAEAVPEEPADGKSCETCVCWPDMPRAAPCHLCVEFSMWKKPKPTEADV